MLWCNEIPEHTATVQDKNDPITTCTLLTMVIFQRFSTFIFIVPPGNKFLCRRTTSKSQIKINI